MKIGRRRITRAGCIVFGLVASVTAGAAPGAAQSIFRLGVPRQHTVPDGFMDYGIQVACASDGSFVLSWISQGVPMPQVTARVFAFDGTPVTSELPVSAPDEGLEVEAHMAADAAGNFVVVWPTQNGDGSGDAGVRLRRFTAMGVGSPEAGANSHTSGFQGYPRVARRSTGEFVIVWSGVGPGSVTGIWMRRFDAAGTPAGPEVLVESGAVDFPSIAMRPSTGDYVIAWQTTGASEDIRARRFDAAGTPVGAAFDVNSSTAGDQAHPTVAMAPGGAFVVLYLGNGQGDADGALGQLYDASGIAVGGEFWVNWTVTGFVDWASATFLPDGSFAVLYDIGFAGVGYRAYVARYSSIAVRDGFGDFPVTLALAEDRSQFGLSACADGTATLRVPFQEGPNLGKDQEVFTQRISLGLFADGLESGDAVAWSSSVP